MKQVYFVVSVILSGCFASFPLGDLDGQVATDSDTLYDDIKEIEKELS